MTNYTIKALEEELTFNQTMHNTLISVIESEHEYIMSALLEAGEGENGVPASNKEVVKRNNEQTKLMNKKNSLWEKIKIVFQNLIKTFKQKAVNNVDTWLNTNLATLNKVDYSKIQVTIPVYRPIDDIKNYTTAILNTLNGSAQRYLSGPNEKSLSPEELQKTILSDYLDEKGNFSEGLKAKLKYGDAKKKATTKTLTGDAAKDGVTNCIEYCQTYSKETVRWVESVMSKVEANIKSMENIASPVKDSVHTSIIESVNTDISILMEEPQNTTQTSTQTTSSNNQNEEPKVGVKMIGNNSGGIKPASTSEHKTLDAFYQTEKLIVTTVMTVCESILFDYFKILKDIAKTVPEEHVNNQS